MMRISVIIAGVLGIIAQRFVSATPSSQTFLGQGACDRRMRFTHGVRRFVLFEHQHDNQSILLSRPKHHRPMDVCEWREIASSGLPY